MKIIISSTVPCSLQTFYHNVLKELSVKYEVIGLSSLGEALEEVSEHEGVRIIGVSMVRHISPWKDLLALLKLIRVFKKEQPTMVHSMTPKAGLLCMMAAYCTLRAYESPVQEQVKQTPSIILVSLAASVLLLFGAVLYESFGSRRS
jgi:hypothetical protein